MKKINWMWLIELMIGIPALLCILATLTYGGMIEDRILSRQSRSPDPASGQTEICPLKGVDFYCTSAEASFENFQRIAFPISILGIVIAGLAGKLRRSNT